MDTPPSPPALSRRLRTFALNTALLCASLLFIVLALEVFLRVSNIAPMSVREVPIHRPSAIEGVVYEFIPNMKTRGWGRETITINSEGFRSPKRDPQKPLVAVVGDSYAFGYGVEDNETNPAYLQQLLTGAFVLNTGVNGYNIEQEARVFRERLAPLKPKLVIVEFVWNDMDPKGYFDENGIIRVGWRSEEEVDEETRRNITREGLLNFPGKFFLQKQSALFNFVERKTKGLPFRSKQYEDFFGDSLTREQLASYEEWFTVLTDAAAGSGKLFVIWPEPGLHLESRAFLKRMAEGKGWKVLDLYEILGNNVASLGWDFHPTPGVHKRVAEILAQAIRHYGLLE